MKRFFPFHRTLSFLLSFLLLLLSSSCTKEPPQTIQNIPFTVLGAPMAASSPEGDIARCPWDMRFYEGKLYIGGGDYDKNAGPVTLYRYDSKQEAWENSGTLAEEEINRFLVLGGDLTVPGVDPKEDWSFGNYYTLEDDSWEKHRTLPNGIHNFDLISYNGALFAGLGVEQGRYPVVRSTDDGTHFEEVVFKKNGLAVDTGSQTTVRTYDLFEFYDTLYATLSLGDEAPLYELYRYDEERNHFVFASDLTESVLRIRYNHMRITSKAVYYGELFFVTGRLYSLDKDLRVTEIKIPNTALICDLYEEDRALYLLTAAKNKDDGSFKASVWQAHRIGGETVFCELFNLDYAVPPVSLAVDGDDFYLGMGNTTAKNEKNGTVLLVELPQ